MTESADRKTGKAMGAMEETITDLQDEVAIAKTPPANHFKPMWLLAAIVVVVLVGGGTFLAVSRLAVTAENASAINRNCRLRNEQFAAINEKFEQLNILILAALRNRPEGSPEPAPEVLAAFGDLRKPIPLQSCESLSSPPLGGR